MLMFDNSKITGRFQQNVVHCDYSVGALRLRGWSIAALRLGFRHSGSEAFRHWGIPTINYIIP